MSKFLKILSFKAKQDLYLSYFSLFVRNGESKDIINPLEGCLQG